jgi:hypothetical protein
MRIAFNGWHFLLFILFFGILTLSTPGWCTSGLELIGEIVMDSPTNPPPSELTQTTFHFNIRNSNSVCDEEMKFALQAVGGFVNDPKAERAGISPKGYSKFLGFKRNLSDLFFSESLDFEIEDETTVTIYFAVETGEDSDGCDFNGFDVAFHLCDTGNHCFFCCDTLIDGDRPCEEPTPFSPKISVRAPQVAAATGTGKIYGHVTDASTGKGLLASISVRKKGNCVHGGPDNADTYSNNFNTNQVKDRGAYETGPLPYGTYEVAPVKDGIQRTSKTVSVTAGTPNVEVDFTY